MDLQTYGFRQDMVPKNAKGIPARIMAVHKERFLLVCEHGERYGKLKTGAYYNNSKESFPTVGDFVLINYILNGDSLIIATLSRITYFSRRDPSPGRGEQAVAANFDYVFIMQSFNRDFNTKRLERYLALSWQSGAMPVVILTKNDLAEDQESYLRSVWNTAPGVDVFSISTKTGNGLEELSAFLKPCKTAVFLGSSGVGKSSLVNWLAGESLMAIREIREDDSRGRHTTSHRQLFLLKNGVMLIDTPGMRELGMWDVSNGLGEAFSDVKQYLGKCKFTDCKHQSEPGCTVKTAIKNGELSQKRWESYVSLENEAIYTDNKERYLMEKEKRFKEIALCQKKMQKVGYQKPDFKKQDYRHTACVETFTCKSCGSFVAPEGAGSGHRNHCPKCLSSLHVDNQPGDRASLCHGVMDPIGVWVRKNGEWAIIHRCRSCGELNSNRVAADDNPALLMSIAVRPLAAPPFPLGEIGALWNTCP